MPYQRVKRFAAQVSRSSEQRGRYHIAGVAFEDEGLLIVPAELLHLGVSVSRRYSVTVLKCVVHAPVAAGVYGEATAVRGHVVDVSDAPEAAREAINMQPELRATSKVQFGALLVAFALAFQHWDRCIHATTMQPAPSLPDPETKYVIVSHVASEWQGTLAQLTSPSFCSWWARRQLAERTADREAAPRPASSFEAARR